MLITDQVAHRLEMAEAADAAACAEAAARLEPRSSSAVASIAGGYLTFCGPASPLTHAIAVGLGCPVTIGDLDAIEEFFQSRDAPVTIDVTPHSDPSLLEILSHRGYRMAEFNNVLVRSVSPGEEPPEVPSEARVRPAQPHESELFTRTVVGGFFGRAVLTDDELRVGRILFAMPYGKPLLAEIQGEAAGACSMSLRDGVASCFADATLPVFRRRNIQSAMIATRIAEAIAAGCELLTAGTQPGSTSQNNYQKLGFQVAYSKMTLVLD